MGSEIYVKENTNEAKVSCFDSKDGMMVLQ
jgi:hypothetical protein